MAQTSTIARSLLLRPNAIPNEEPVMSISFNPRTLVAVLLMLFAGPAFAICPFFPFHVRVGADPVYCEANDIQSAINSVSTCAVIIDITREHTYTQQHLTIAEKPNITLQGWGDGVTCADIPSGEPFGPPYAPPTSTQPLVTLDGSNDGQGRVLTITGNSNVGLRNLTVTGGQTADSASGGGISFDGQGSLYLTNSLIVRNYGGYGAGININGSSGPTSLTLGEYTQISLNTAAVSGGGVRIEGNTRLYALKPHTLIGLNHAPNGYGGGIEVLGPARADIGSPGYNGTPVIYGNDAQYGGGIAQLAINDGADAVVRLFTTDPNNPVQISSNTASHTGGAVYMKPRQDASGSGASTLCAYDFRINDNSAQEGSAIYSDMDHSSFALDSIGGSVNLNATMPFNCSHPELPATLGAVACTAGIPCNEFVGNSAAQNGQPTAGSTILLQSSSFLEADRFSASANSGAHVVRVVADGGDSGAALSNCLLAKNTLTAEVVAMTDGDDITGDLTIDSCTIAGNTIGSQDVILARHSLSFANNIVDQMGHPTVDFSGAFFNVDDVLSNDISTLPMKLGIVLGQAPFVDAAHGNYRLLPTSIGVDFSPAGSGLDLDGKRRTVNLPNVDVYGPMDLGAYEIQDACSRGDTIFCDGFGG